MKHYTDDQALRKIKTIVQHHSLLVELLSAALGWLESDGHDEIARRIRVVLDADATQVDELYEKQREQLNLLSMLAGITKGQMK